MGKKGVWMLVLAAVVLAAGLAVTQKVRSRRHVVAYRTDTLQRGDIKVTVSASGTLDAVTTVQVGSQVSGTIAHLYADFNDRVKKGQLLAELDPTFLRAQVAQNQADLSGSEVQLHKALRDSARVFPLGKLGLASQADLDNAQTSLDAARAGVAASKAALDRARTNLQYATILSPIDGVVVSRNVDVGQTVAASLSAPTLFTIANDLTQMQLATSVDEADIGQIKEGQNSTFTVDAYPDRVYEGVIHQIRLAPTTVQNVVTYSVIIYVSNPDQSLLPGMTANVTIQVAEAKNVLKAPSLALRFRPMEGGNHAGNGAMASTTGMGGGNGSGGRGGNGGGPGGGSPGAGGPGGGQGGRGGSGGGGQGNWRGRAGQEGQAGGSDQAGHGGGQGGAGQGGRGERGGWGDHGGEAGGGAPGAPHMARGTIYELVQPQSLKLVQVRTGLTDGTFTEVAGDSLREGMPVVLGLDLTGGAGGSSSGQVNPFAPRFPGGGRR